MGADVYAQQQKEENSQEPCHSVALCSEDLKRSPLWKKEKRKMRKEKSARVGSRPMTKKKNAQTRRCAEENVGPLRE